MHLSINVYAADVCIHISVDQGVRGDYSQLGCLCGWQDTCRRYIFCNRTSIFFSNLIHFGFGMCFESLCTYSIIVMRHIFQCGKSHSTAILLFVLRCRCNIHDPCAISVASGSIKEDVVNGTWP